MKIGIVGSRLRTKPKDRIMVFDIVFESIKVYGASNVTIVSGGCPVGADFYAEEAARYFGVSITIHYPVTLPVSKSYYETVERMYARNRKVAEDCDVLYGLIQQDRRGGTEYTVNHAKKLKKKCFAVLTTGEYVEEKISP